MTKLKTITQKLVGILLVSMLVIGCGCGNRDTGKGNRGTGKGSRDTGKRSRDTDKGSKDADKGSKKAEETKKLVNKQKKLVQDFNQKYKLTPGQAKDFEKDTDKRKNDSLQVIKIEISRWKRIKAEFESGDPTGIEIELIVFRARFKLSVPGFVIKDKDHAKRILTDHIAILKNIKKQIELKDE